MGRETWLGAVNDNDAWEIDNTTDSSIEYWGYAQPGTVTSAAAWKIIKITKDASGVMIRKRFAGGSPSYSFIYDNRTALSYS